MGGEDGRSVAVNWKLNQVQGWGISILQPFLPLFIAVIHLAVSLYAVAMLLAMFGRTNVLVLLLCAGKVQ